MRRIVRSHKKRRPHLFLSHSSDDASFSRRLANSLNRLGIDVWFDQWDLEGGDSLSRTITDALTKSRYVGVVISLSFLKSTWCLKELSVAREREKRQRSKVLVPILYKRAKPPQWVAKRVYVQFTARYYAALAELGGLIHGFGRQRIAEYLNQTTLRSVSQVEDMFVALGWDGAALLDSRDFDVLAPLRGVRARGNVIEFYPDRVLTLNKSLSPRAKQLIRKAKKDG